MPDKITKDMDGLEQTKIFFSTLWRILRFPILIVVLFFILINVAFGAVQEPASTGAWQTNSGSVTDSHSDRNTLVQYVGNVDLATSTWHISWGFDLATPAGTNTYLVIQDDLGNCRINFPMHTSHEDTTGTSTGGDCSRFLPFNVDYVEQDGVGFHTFYGTSTASNFRLKGDLYIGLADNIGDEFRVAGTEQDVYTSGHAFWDGSLWDITSEDAQTSLEDMYFLISETGETISQDGGDQSFVDPVDQENKQEDFNIWRVETSIGADATSTAESDILDTYAWTVYVNTTTTFGNNEQDNITSLPESVIAPGETSTLGLSKNTALPSGNYFARSELWYVADEDGDGDLEASEVTILASDEIEFSIDPFSPATYEDPSTATTTDLTVTCDPDSGFFQESLCKMNQTLFIPDPDAVRQFEGLGDEVRNKPPWGYFFVVKDELNKLKSTTTEAYSMPDTSALDSTFDDLKTTVRVILWFVFVVWIVIRFKHLN